MKTSTNFKIFFSFLKQTWGELIVNANALLMHFFRVIQQFLHNYFNANYMHYFGQNTLHYLHYSDNRLTET